MAHLLMIESWVRATGLILPQKIRKLGHTYTLFTRQPEHYRSWAKGAGLLPGEFAGEHPVVALADEVVVTETNDLNSLRDAVEKLHRKRPFDGVVSCCDYYLETVAEIAHSLGLGGPPPSAVAVARRKHFMREACRRAGIPGPAFLATADLAQAQAFAESIGFPVVIKAVDLSASEQVCAAHSPQDLTCAFEKVRKDAVNIRGQHRPSEVLLEGYLRGEEFSVETVTYRGETSVIGITDKSLAGPSSFIETGLMHPAAVSEEIRRELADFVRSVLVAVGYTHGLTHTEVKLTQDGPRIVEINVRMGGSFLFEIVELVTGVDVFECLIDLALDRHPRSNPKRTLYRSAALRFLLPPSGGVIESIEGAEEIRKDPDIYRLVVDDVVGKTVRPPEDNNDFIGYVLATDKDELGARHKAEQAASRLRVRMA